MLTIGNLTIPTDKLIKICQQWKITALALFVSVPREDFRKDSDIDFLVPFDPEASQGLLTLAKIKYQLEDVLHRNVDLVVKEAIQNGDNWIRRQKILNTTMMIHES